MVVGHPPTVVAFPRKVQQCLDGWLVRLIDVLLQLPDADAQVRLVELVVLVPTERSKLAPLLHYRVEEGEPEDDLLPHLRPVAGLEEGGVAQWVRRERPEEVPLEASGGLSHHFEPVLEEADGEFGRRHGREPQAEITVDPALHVWPAVFPNQTLQGRHPRQVQMAVLQQNPQPLLPAELHLLCRPLTHAHPQGQALQLLFHAVDLCKVADVVHRVRPRREDEDQGIPRLGAEVDAVQVEQRRADEALPKPGGDEGADCGDQHVRAQRADKDQAGQRVGLHPGGRQGRGMR
mmetsp:Transcript_133841/g.232250  ORF Transcript_133841/g.232250 Transcript_133841/m.232250 type:complete len:291 (+) Transcript_133841:1595-2467(+)